MLSDREIKNVIGFYMGLRKAALVAGVVVMVASVVAVIALAYIMGRENGGHAAAGSSPSGQAETAPHPKARRVVRRHVEAPPPEIEEVEQPGNNEAAAPEMPAATEVDLQAPRAALVVSAPRIEGRRVAPVPVEDGKQTVDAFAARPGNPEFSVTVHPKKHGRLRRFFGAIGRGVGKAFGGR